MAESFPPGAGMCCLQHLLSLMLCSLSAAPARSGEAAESGQKSPLYGNCCQLSWQHPEPGGVETEGKKKQHKEEEENPFGVLQMLIK